MNCNETSTTQYQMRAVVAHLNNEGATMIDAGNCEGGTDVLKQALRASKRLIAEQRAATTLTSPVGQKQDTCSFADQASNASRQSLSLNQLVSLKVADDPEDVHMEAACKSSYFGGVADCGKCDESNDVDAPFLFRNPIRIRPIAEDILHMAESNHLLSTVVVFNLGIAVHRRAADTRSKQSNHPLHHQEDEGSALLRKAIYLYECALDMLQKPNRVYGKETMLLAILNNMAYAHSSLHNVETVKKISQYLLSVLMMVVDQKSRGIRQQYPNFNIDSETDIIIARLFQSTHYYIYVANSQLASAA